MGTKIKKAIQSQSLYTVGEEIANSITHGIGAILSLAGLTMLVLLASLFGTVWHIVGFSIYGTTLFLMYLISTLYHSFSQPRVKRVFRIMDHASIYLLIAGTYTPLFLIPMRSFFAWIILAIVWALAISGIIFKIYFVGRFEVVSVIFYILMGWLGAITPASLLDRMPEGSLGWILAGGIVYTVGVLFYSLHKIPYNHAIWHIFVIGGSFCHYWVMLIYILDWTSKI
ncbi:MAG: hemolysin III [Anaerolineaceae bacterium 4572_78]|nr:MAG: hemolysin III [Anaerolineaceae bacterium 4572_78]